MEPYLDLVQKYKYDKAISNFRTSSHTLSVEYGKHENTHYNDVIMDAMASQITSLTIVYSPVYSGADQRKHQSSASLAFDRWIPRTNGQ